MIVFFDPWGLIKLYVAEPGSGPARQALKNASAVYAVDASYLSVRTAFAQAARTNLLTQKAATKAREEFDRDWQGLHVATPDQALLKTAADIAEAHGVGTSIALNVAAIKKISEYLGPQSLRFQGHQAAAALISKLGLATV